MPATAKKLNITQQIAQRTWPYSCSTFFELARRVGIHITELAAIVNGEAPFSEDIEAKMCAVFRIPIGTLFTEARDGADA